VIKPRLILCSGTPDPARPQDETRFVTRLDALGNDPNVTIKLPDITRILGRAIPDRMVDLLEIASYVFTADAATRRGSEWKGAEEPWGRDLRFVIPVRDLAFWSQVQVADCMINLLSYLSDDVFSFEFVPLVNDRLVQGYLELANTDWRSQNVQRVIMFSGGLDSLAGTIESAAKGEPLVLVSHRSIGQMSERQSKLVRKIRERFPQVPILHVPVWINKANALGHEPTQRTRSFLFGSLALCICEMVSSQGVRFYENGIVSLNLPVADEVLRARASRTTHPHTLRLISQLGSLVLERPITVDNPFLLQTKADVVRKTVDAGCGDLVGLSVSCAHPMFKSKTKQHCGCCSQCIDRRIGVLAAGHEELDPATDYVTDVFTGRRNDIADQNMAIHYVRHASELSQMGPEEFAGEFSLDLSRATRGADNSSQAVAEIYETHQRHSRGVVDVITEQIRAHASGLVDGTLDPLSMIGLIADRRHKQEMWNGYSVRIEGVLAEAIPIACRTNKPINESGLQEIAEAILKGHDPDLRREFPFLRWSVVGTKPDFSKDQISFWVELKFIRKKVDIGPITEAIAADITKYGDGGKRVLFVVYDPLHLVVDDRAFAQEIERRATMRVKFIR
jgi:7-cyano-7-deazaguanine synthase in queuosine biosynthesis